MIDNDKLAADIDADDIVTDFDDDDVLDLDHVSDRIDDGEQSGGRGLQRALMGTVAVVAIAGVGLGYLATAGAAQLGQAGEKIVTELSALDDGELTEHEIAMPSMMGLENIEPASGEPASAPALGGMGIPTAPSDAVTEDGAQAEPAPAPAPVSDSAPLPPATEDVAETPPASAPEPAPAPIVLSNDTPTPPIPDLSGVADAPAPDQAASATGGEAASGAVESDTVTSVAAPGTDADVYYDSQPGVPTGALSNTVGPRKVDPVMEPASKMVIVTKDHGVKDQESLVVAAGRALELGRYEAALDMYNALYKKNKRDIRILMGRAVAQQNAGFKEMAIKSYEEVLDLDPRNADAVVNMMGLIREEYPSVALRRLLDMKEKHPGNAGIMAQIGMTYAAMGQGQDAVNALSSAASLDPQNAVHQYNLAVLFDQAGDRGNALRHYEQALETDAVYGGNRSVPRDQIYDRLSTIRSQ